MALKKKLWWLWHINSCEINWEYDKHFLKKWNRIAFNRKYPKCIVHNKGKCCFIKLWFQFYVCLCTSEWHTESQCTITSHTGYLTFLKAADIWEYKIQSLRRFPSITIFCWIICFSSKLEIACNNNNKKKTKTEIKIT